jgi:acyl-CoA dehydrogenase
MDFQLDEDQQLFRGTVRAWVERECPKDVARQLESREYVYPEALWEALVKGGFVGLGVPPEYGGQGADLMTQVILQRELARSLAGLTWVWGISAFCARAVHAFGGEALRHEVLTGLAEGRSRLAMAVTEPGGGTDIFGAIRTTGTKVPGGWRIDGQKMWSTGAAAAQHLLLLVRTDPEPAKPSGAFSMFLVPSPSEGLTIRPIPKLGMRALASCEVFLDGVEVGDEHLLGEVGRGWHQMVMAIDAERVLLAALCCGIIDGVLEDAIAYAHEREAFGRPIGQFQAIQHHIADIAMWQRQAELVTWYAASLPQDDPRYGLEANMAKVVASEHAVNAADLGIQILGGMGYSLETDMQRYWRDARLFRIGPVTNEVTRNMIAEGLGLPRAR